MSAAIRRGQRRLTRPVASFTPPSRPPRRCDAVGPPSRSSSPSRSSPQSPLRVADLFAGIGGFYLAFQGVAEVVFAAKNDRHARLTYEANFRQSTPHLFTPERFVGDITAVPSGSVPDIDVLTAGFPCQPFSQAGKRRGFDDVRGTLFFEIARLLDDKRPAAYFLENVRGLLTNDGGRTFATIRTVLTEQLGYSLHAKVVKASDFGLPQHRPRVFMVGFRDPSIPFAFPDPVPLTTKLGDILGGQTDRDVAYTLLASHRYGQPGRQFNWDAYIVDGRVHHLTVDEMRRLQGFPDDFVFPVAKSHAAKQLGNAVAVPAVRATALRISDALRCRPAPQTPRTHHHDVRRAMSDPPTRT